MAWLLDTNILSEIRRLRPEPRVLTFISNHPLEQLYISTVTLAELRFGIELLSEGSSRRDELNQWLAENGTAHVRAAGLAGHRRHHVPVAGSGEEGRKVGHTYSQPDLIIAATALHHGLTMVTRDRGDSKNWCAYRGSLAKKADS